jgi:hypothetical protein
MGLFYKCESRIGLHLTQACPLICDGLWPTMERSKAETLNEALRMKKPSTFAKVYLSEIPKLQNRTKHVLNF